MKLLCQYLIFSLLLLVVCSCANSTNEVQPKSTLFKQPWISGLDKNEPTLQVQYLNDNIAVIRQSLKTSFEAPFIYLIFGQEKALLIDTGAGGVDLRSTIDELIETRLQSTGHNSLALVVMHSHAHGDHTAGDEQFINRENTVVIGHEPNDVASFFSINNWPGETKPYDLGNYMLDIIPTPGHQDSHIMIYDRTTQLLFSGDVLYPGRLYFQCGKADLFQQSINRLVEFTKTNPVAWVLGAHIELAQTIGKSYNSNDLKRKDERLLEMSAKIITDVQLALQKMDSQPRVTAYDDFILFPHPADPKGKRPPNWCLDKS